LVAYLTTGDWWHWSNLRDVAAAALMEAPLAYVSPKQRINGYPDWSQTRTVAWSIRDWMLAARMSPDGTPEKNYFMQKWNNFIACEDGLRNTLASRFYAPPLTSPFSYLNETTVWGLGRGYMKGTFISDTWPNPLGGSPGTGECDDAASGLNHAVIPSGSYC